MKVSRISKLVHRTDCRSPLLMNIAISHVLALRWQLCKWPWPWLFARWSSLELRMMFTIIIVVITSILMGLRPITYINFSQLYRLTAHRPNNRQNWRECEPNITIITDHDHFFFCPLWWTWKKKFLKKPCLETTEGISSRLEALFFVHASNGC